MTFVHSVPSEAERWVLPRKCKVVTPAESELQGGAHCHSFAEISCVTYTAHGTETPRASLGSYEEGMGSVNGNYLAER